MICGDLNGKEIQKKRGYMYTYSGLPSMGSHRVRHDCSDLQQQQQQQQHSRFTLLYSRNKHSIVKQLCCCCSKSLQSCPTLCDPMDGSPPGSPSLGFSRQEHWSGLPFPSPMHESEKWKWSHSVVSDSSDPTDCSLPGSSVHGIFQARVLEWGGWRLGEGWIGSLGFADANWCI